VTATGVAAAKIRGPITLMVPLVRLVANDRPMPVTIQLQLPRSLVLDGMPMYALDKHTRTGREAIRNLVKYNYEIRECLRRLPQLSGMMLPIWRRFMPMLPPWHPSSHGTAMMNWKH
jgi:hypothetical protein